MNSYEYKTKKRISNTTIAIIILLVIILAFGGYGYLCYRKGQAEIDEVNAKAQALEEKTAKVERGELAVTLDDIYGTVRSNQSVYLYWQISGTVADVNVEVGDEVKKGDVLAELDSGTVDSSIVEALVTKEQAEEKLERLYTSPLELEQKRSAVVSAKKSVSDAQDVVNAQGVVREDNLEIGVKYDDYQKAVQSYNDAVKRYEEVRDLALDNPDRMRAVSMVENSKTRMDSAKAQYNWYNGETDANEVQQADAALKLAEAKLADAERAYDRIKDGPTESQVRSIQAEIDAAEATINTSKIVSPIDGTVAQVEAKPFDVITYESNMSEKNILAVRVDDLSSHYIDITIAEQDINSISIGQKVKITFDAIPLREYSGTVSNISNAGNVNNLSVNYSLTVRMDDPDEKIKSGMMVNIAIVTQSVEDALSVPFRALQTTENGGFIVKKIESDGSTTEIPVRLGLQTADRVQIITDQLREGDEVELTSRVRNTGFSMFGMQMGGGMGGPGGGGRPGGGMGGPGGGGRRP